MQNIILSPIPISELVELIGSDLEARFQKAEHKEPPPDRIGLKEAIEFTGLKHSAIYKMTMKSEIPHEKFGKKLVFSRKELLIWIESRTIRKPNPEKVISTQLQKEAGKRQRRVK